jgi:hypothetical protein
MAHQSTVAIRVAFFSMHTGVTEGQEELEALVAQAVLVDVEVAVEMACKVEMA